MPAAWLLTTSLVADTVFLKNGAWIDGRVKARNDKTIQIEIGKIGRMEIAASEVYEIEKNNRSGEEAFARKPGDDGNIVQQPTKEKSESEGTSEEEAGGTTKSGETKGSKEEARKDAEKSPASAGKEDPKAKIDPALKSRIEELVTELQRQKPQNRTRAERHLKAIGAPAIPYLLPLVKHESDLTRVAAMRLLNDFGDETAVETCIDALLDSNEYVRDLANKTLEHVTHESFGYEAQASPRRRETAQEKWRKWWEAEQEELAKEKELSAQAR